MLEALTRFWSKLTFFGKFILVLIAILPLTIVSLIIFPPQIPAVGSGPELFVRDLSELSQSVFEGTVFASENVFATDISPYETIREFLLIENNNNVYFVEKTANVSVGTRIRATGLLDSNNPFGVARLINSSIEILSQDYPLPEPVFLNASLNFSDFIGRFVILKNLPFITLDKYNLGEYIKVDEITVYSRFNASDSELLDGIHYDYTGVIIELNEYGRPLWLYATKIEPSS